MKEIESLHIRYVGYKEPSNDEEVEFEILGLSTAIAAAQQRIAVLTQGIKLEQMARDQNAQKKQKPEVKEENDETTVAETPDTEETEQKG